MLLFLYQFILLLSYQRILLLIPALLPFNYCIPVGMTCSSPARYTHWDTFSCVSHPLVTPFLGLSGGEQLGRWREDSTISSYLDILAR